MHSFVEPKLATQIFVCSDDQLMGFGVRTADHIIHYDLPDDFDTFSLRYSVFTLSHCRFQVSFINPNEIIFNLKMML